MKNTILILTFFVLTLSVKAELLSKITPEGTGYMVDYAGADKANVIFFHGFGERGNGTTDLNKIKAVYFFKDFYQKNIGKYNFYFPQYPSTASGWGMRACLFYDRILSDYSFNGNILITGHSAGGTGVMAVLYYLNDNGKPMPTAAHVVAGEGDYKAVMRMAANCPPLRLSVGDRDNSITTQDGKTIYQKMQSLYTWLAKKPDWKVYAGVGHGSDVIAYSIADDLAGWFKQYCTSTAPPPLSTVETLYRDADSTLIFKTSSGQTITFKKQ